MTATDREYTANTLDETVGVRDLAAAKRLQRGGEPLRGGHQAWCVDSHR